MVSPVVFAVAVVVGFIILFLFFIALGRILPKPRPSRSHRANEITPYRTRRTRQNDNGQSTSNGGEEINEIYTEAGLVCLEYSPTSRTDGITVQSHNDHRPTSLTISNGAAGELGGANSDGANAPFQVAQSSVAVRADFPFTPGPEAHIRRAVRNAADSRRSLRNPVQHIPADALQMASIMQQMDEMRAEIARLRQSQVEAVRLGASETGSMMLPDYASTDERFRFQGAIIPQGHIHRSTSPVSVGNSEAISTLLPDYSSLAGPGV